MDSQLGSSNTWRHMLLVLQVLIWFFFNNVWALTLKIAYRMLQLPYVILLFQSLAGCCVGFIGLSASDSNVCKLFAALSGQWSHFLIVGSLHFYGNLHTIKSIGLGSMVVSQVRGAGAVSWQILTMIVD